MDTPPVLAAIVGAFVLAGFAKGVIGMGLPTVSIGLLGLLLTPAQAAALLLVPSLVTNIWQAAAGDSLVPLAKRLAPMLAGICIGTFMGAMLLPHDDSGRATVFLGAVLASYAVLGLANVQFKLSSDAETWLGAPIGMLTGMLTVVTGVFVIPATPYLQALQLNRNQLIQAMGLSFTVSTVALAGALQYSGEIGLHLARPALFALAAALTGMALGQIARKRIGPHTFRLCFFIGLLLLGLHLALHGLL
ncbi:MAG: sulfite exporter TauE/SafE family protein [Pseudolabrys sp.]|nr:sulfite exporter TauE/SafE family protein [Pseudolabrys sp.]